MKNYSTVMVVPGKNGRVISFRISTLFFKMAIFAAIGLAVGSLVISLDYVLIKQKERDQRKLSETVILQKFKIREIDNILSGKRRTLEQFKNFEKKLRIILGVKEPALRVGFANESERALERESDGDANERRILETLEELDADIKSREVNFFQLEAHLYAQKARLARTPSIAPTKGYISSRFGRRLDPFTGRLRWHRGLDIANRPYTPIYAPADGVVVNLKRSLSYGNLLIIDHGYDIVTKYGHLQHYEAKLWDDVKRGDLIGRMGNTGRSSGPHLHYEVLVKNKHVNPVKYILEYF